MDRISASFQEMLYVLGSTDELDPPDHIISSPAPEAIIADVFPAQSTMHGPWARKHAVPSARMIWSRADVLAEAIALLPGRIEYHRQKWRANAVEVLRK